MNWDQVGGQMKQVGGKLKEKWAKLTDDDLLLLAGRKDMFLGVLQERSGIVKEEVEKQFDAFMSMLDFGTPAANTPEASTKNPS